MKDYFVFLIYKFLVFLFRITPNFLLKYILVLLSKIVYTLNKKHRKIVDVNLDIAFKKQLTITEKENISCSSYRSLMFNMFEFVENQYLNKEGILGKAEITNEKVILDAIKNNRKIIFMTAHYGGWEIALPFMALKYGTIAVVNRKMNNGYMQEMYAQARDNNNIIMLEKSVAAKGMIKAFKQDQFVAVVIDQHIGVGVEIDFFDEKVMATDSTSRMALKFDAVIIPVFAVMNDFRDYTIKIGTPIDVKEVEFKTEDKIQELTQMQNSLVEKQIKEKPELWFWQHKRFKHKHDELYKRALDEK
mgnify:CR=1 FL=1